MSINNKGIMRRFNLKKEYKEPIDSHRIDGHTYCIAEEMIEQGIKNQSGDEYVGCGSSDAMASYISEYEDGTETYSSYCFSCAQSFRQDHLARSGQAEDFGLDPKDGKVRERKTFERKPKQPKITRDQVEQIMSHGYDCVMKSGVNRGNPIRNIKEKYNKFFGHITKKDRNGNPTVRFYPETSEGSMMGYKSRTFPKGFGYENVGITGIKNDLSGQVKFKDMQFRDICIVAGEEDKVAFFQQFDEYQERRFSGSDQEFAPMPVVSPTTGEGSAVKQLRNQYDFVNRAERIFIGMDNDEAGRKAASEIAAIFPKEKVFIITWSYKDPNNAINNKEGKDYSAQTIRDFYNAKPFNSSGIVTSKQADGLIEDELLRPKIPLAPFMKDLQKKMAGGIPLGYWVNFIAESGIGKSTLVNESIRHMIFNANYKVGILSLELTASQYMIAMLSREVGKKINLFESPEEAVEFVRTPEVMKARIHLRENEYGEERFTILDEREGDLEDVKIQCELLVNKHGCQIIVIDPIQDLFEGVSMDLQNSFVKWMKGMLKRGVTFVNVCHVRKGNTSTDKEGHRIMRELSEDDVHGISAVVKSAGANVFMSRNKYAEHFIEKNSTFVTLGKCRWTGNTGRIGTWYYDNDSHTMYDLREYFKSNPDKLGDYNLDYDPFTKQKPEGFSKRAGGGSKEVESIKMEVEPLTVSPQKLPEFKES